MASDETDYVRVDGGSPLGSMINRYTILRLGGGGSDSAVSDNKFYLMSFVAMASGLITCVLLLVLYFLEDWTGLALSPLFFIACIAVPWILYGLSTVSSLVDSFDEVFKRKTSDGRPGIIGIVIMILIILFCYSLWQNMGQPQALFVVPVLEACSAVSMITCMLFNNSETISTIHVKGYDLVVTLIVCLIFSVVITAIVTALTGNFDIFFFEVALVSIVIALGIGFVEAKFTNKYIGRVNDRIMLAAMEVSKPFNLFLIFLVLLRFM